MNKQLVIKKTHHTPGPGPAGLVWDEQALWLNDYREGRLYELDPASCLAQREMVCAGVISGLTWDGRHLWQSRLDENWLQQINPATQDIERTVALDGHPRLADITWDGEHLWAVSQQNGELLALDPDSELVVRRCSVPAAAGGLAYHDGTLWLGVPDSMVYMAETDSFEWQVEKPQYTLLQINPADGQELNRFRLGFLPLGITWIGETIWLAPAGLGKLYEGGING